MNYSEFFEKEKPRCVHCGNIAYENQICAAIQGSNEVHYHVKPNEFWNKWDKENQ